MTLVIAEAVTDDHGINACSGPDSQRLEARASSLRLNLTPSMPLAILPMAGFAEFSGRREAEMLDILRLQLAILDTEEPRTIVG